MSDAARELVESLSGLAARVRHLVVAEGSSDVAAHHTTHESGGSDAIKLDDLASPDDNTDLNATASAHGLLPKLSGSATQVLPAMRGYPCPYPRGASLTPDQVALMPSNWTTTLLRAIFHSLNIPRLHGLLPGSYQAAPTQVLAGDGALISCLSSVIVHLILGENLSRATAANGLGGAVGDAGALARC